MRTDDVNRLAGVIEGFYGKPWTPAERIALFDWMAGWQLDTYVYAPKDDLKHRAVWRECYGGAEADQFRALIHECRTRGLRFVYALSPGLDIRYDDPSELVSLQRRLDQMIALGCRDFSVLFDDIPDRLDAAAIARFGSLAAAQADVANALFRWIREREPTARVAFCPTPYCSRMVQAGLGGAGYLETIGRALRPEIDVFWTGPEIVSREIPLAHVQDIAAILRRPPLIWDNLHANDYDGRRFFCGPYSGRPPALRHATSGLLINPNNELPLNYVPLHTFAAFVRAADAAAVTTAGTDANADAARPSSAASTAGASTTAAGGASAPLSRTIAWDPRAAYLAAMREWAARFDTIGGPTGADDLILLGDCFYLPYDEGQEAEALHQHARGLLDRHPRDWGEDAGRVRALVGRLRGLCVRLTELRERPLFHALSRRIWDLREELDLLDRYIAAHAIPTGTAGAGSAVGTAGAAAATTRDAGFRSDFHRPGTYRGGLVARLQQLLVQHPDGTFTPAAASASAPETLPSSPLSPLSPSSPSSAAAPTRGEPTR